MVLRWPRFFIVGITRRLAAYGKIARDFVKHASGWTGWVKGPDFEGAKPLSNRRNPASRDLDMMPVQTSAKSLGRPLTYKCAPHLLHIAVLALL